MSFKISSIEIVHPDKSLTSKIEFSDGLTVIHGNSNSGKSLVFICIDHVFGRKLENEKSKFPMDMGYTDIVMRIKHDSGKMVVISRPIDSNLFEVISEIPQIESGTYSIQASKTRRPISNVFLKLIGFEEPEVYKVVKNQSKLTGASFTWRTFQQLFVLDENSVPAEEPVLLRGEKTARTKVKSALITLLADTNFDELVSEGGAEKERLKNEGTLRYLKQEKQYLKRQLDEDAEWRNDDDSILDDELYEALLKDAESLQSKIDSIVESINQHNQSKADEQARLIELSTYIGHYEELESIYSSKLVRFSAIRKYAQEASHVDKHHLCPVCEQEVPDELEDEISLPDETESETYTQRLTDLRVVLEANKAERAGVEEKLAQINSSITELNDVLAKGLRPQYQSINALIHHYIDENNRFMLHEQRVDRFHLLEDEILRLEEAVAKKDAININDQFPLFFEAQMSKNLMEILKSSGYPNLQTADFSLAGFDAYINNRQKSTQGKGYRSYINSCVTLALYKTLFESAVHNPGFVIIDTPLNGLDDPQEISDDATSELHYFRDNLQHAFYQTLIRLSEYGQIIVMDNNKNLPELPSLEGKCNLIEFTKSTKRGRYGLLEGKTQDDFQDQEYAENELQDKEIADQENLETEKVEVDE